MTLGQGKPATADLSDEEIARLTALRDGLREKLPGFIPLMRDLIELGFATGLRDITYFGPPRPDPPGTVTPTVWVKKKADEDPPSNTHYKS